MGRNYSPWNLTQSDLVCLFEGYNQFATNKIPAIDLERTIAFYTTIFSYQKNFTSIRGYYDSTQ